MGTFNYDDAGTRIPFDPMKMRDRIAGCILCGRRVAAIGVFIPDTDDMRAAVLRLRTHVVPTRTTSAVTYGLCKRHADLDGVTDRVEAAIMNASQSVCVQ